ncbi:sperm receptor for egg jelly-like [Tubulanus polymorphus]|uniref:sperm receptor for egg jelly-like n=1 Tax=Tubulanus polymorphus TaxID=672921 RepID=UPI003DA5460A
MLCESSCYTDQSCMGYQYVPASTTCRMFDAVSIATARASGNNGIAVQVKSQCVNSPCKNFGSCTVIVTLMGAHIPSCMCMTGTSGTYCENSLCSGITCSNHGTCKLTDFGGGHTCVCENNYYGPSCEHGGPCSVNPCQNGGSCTVTSGNNIHCACAAGHTGSRCQTGPCSNGWIHGGGNHCYIISTVATLPSLVGNVCAHFEAWPAVFTDKAESLVIANELKRESIDKALIGVKRNGDGSYTSKLQYTNWMPNKPGTDANKNECALLKHSDGLWNTKDCNLIHKAVCQCQGSLCSDGSWSRFGNKGHRVIHDLLSWSSASKRCRQLGGTGLVHITTPAENTAVKALSSSDVWIGFHESKPNGGYTWDVEFLNWATGKPGDDACVALLVGSGQSAINRISDVTCDENIQFVCYKGTEGLS